MSGDLAASPDGIWRVIQGFTTYWLTVAALDLGVFAALDARPATVDDLAAELDVSRGRLGILLDGLAAVGLVDSCAEGYGLTPATSTFLVAGRPRYMGDLVLHSPGLPENWPALADTVRGGAPPAPVDDCGSFYAHLVGATFPTQYAAAQRVATALGGPVESVVDLGAGAAPWAIALLEAFPRAQAVVNDLPDVVPLTEATLAEHGVLERARLLPGDYRRVPLAAEAFDVAVLGHVCRAEGEDGARALIARAADALRPGGTLVVADHFVDDAREASVNARLLGVTMMANTHHGATFTHREFREWLGSAGLVRVELLEPLPNSSVMLARKEGPT